ncbi:MAG: helix-turn-helix domain-containing protein [Caldilineaceae bacterium]
MELEVSFGAWLQRRRKALDLTQEALAQRVACSVATIRKIEADERRPSRAIAELLAHALEIPAAEQPRFLRVARGELRVERLATVPTLLPAVPIAADLRQSEPTPAPVAPAPIASSPPQVPPSNLPAPTTALIGRATEVAEVGQLLAQSDCRLLTIVGPGGMGKTRLALAAAQRLLAASPQDKRAAAFPAPQFPDGIYFVALAPLSAAAFMAPALANTLGLAPAGSGEPQQQLLNHLHTKQMLLVLDNIEHLLDDVTLLSKLLQHCHALKLLVTSRERLNLQGEWVFDLQGLPIPAAGQEAAGGQLTVYSAVTLFVERAQRQRYDFALTAQNGEAIAQICRLVNGMPLGIELAAAWVYLLSCQEIAQELAQNLDFLTSTQRDLPARHRSLRAVFDHSWRLLAAEERQALQRLTVFQGGFTRDLAQQVAGVSLSALFSLIAKSLVRRSAEGRYDLHEVVRQFAAEQLEQAGEVEPIARVHAATFLALAEAIDLRRVHGPATEAAMQRLRTERDNLRAALAWSTRQGQDMAAAEIGLRLVAALGQFWSNEGEYQEGRQWLAAALALPAAPATMPQRALALTSLGMQLEGLGEFANAHHCFAQSITLAQAAGEEWTVAWTHYQRAHVLVYQQDLTGAQAAVEESRERFRTLGDRWGVALSHWMMADIAGEQGQHQATLPWLEENLTLFKTLQDEGGLAVTYLHLGNAAMYIGEFARAAEMLQLGLALCQKLKRKGGMRWALASLGILMQMQGEAEQARTYFIASLQLGVELGDKLATVDVIGEVACVAQMRNDAPRAAHLFAAETAWRATLGAPVPGEKAAKHARALAAVRTDLGEDVFAALWRVGQELTLEQATALACEPAQSRA